jgi:low temperature requirement protein LtrA
MADVSLPPRRYALRPPRPTAEHDGATDFELLFDLVYVFAITQVTTYMARSQGPRGLLQGLIILALLWWTWSAYTWLGNQARADEGLVRLVLAAAMVAMFVVALSVPKAWHTPHGELSGSLILVGAYLLVRALHLCAYAAAAGDDPGLRHQLVVTLIPLLLGAALMVPGAILGGWAETILFAAALAVDWTGVYLTSRHGGWRINSAQHWTERQGNFIILAIGESVVAIGVGAGTQALHWPVIVASGLGVAVAISLWWLYFDVVSLAAERRFAQAEGEDRVKLAIEAYTYGHFPLVAGIVITALGVRGVLAHADDTDRLGAFYASALFGGAALYVAGHLLFKQLMQNSLSLPRLAAVAALLVALPAAIYLPPLAGLTLLVVILVALISFESSRYSGLRRSLRDE